MAQAPHIGMPNDRFRRGFGLDPIKSDMPFGSAASVVIHGGILLSAFFAWQVTPRIMPEDVIAVDMVSDTPSVLGELTTPETALTGQDTPEPSPMAQTSPAAVSQAAPTPTPTQIEQAPIPQAQESQIAPAPAPIVQPSPPPPPPPSKAVAAPAPAPKPLPKPAPAPAKTTPVPRQAAQPQPKVAAPVRPSLPPAAKTGQRQPAPKAPVVFDLAAASASASGADSGGRRAPQLAARGQQGRLGKAGGGAQLTGDLEAALRSQIKECWLEPANMADAGRLLVVVSMDIGIDGSLLRDPVLVSPASRAGASPSLVVAIDNALRAVRDCAPYNLPADRYDSWRQVRFNFDPQRMARR